MWCRTAKRKISALMDGALNPRVAKALNRHLESCEACRAELRKAQVVNQALSGLFRPAPKEGALLAQLRERIQRESRTSASTRSLIWRWLAPIPRFAPSVLVVAAGLFVGALISHAILLPSVPLKPSRLSVKAEKTVEAALDSAFGVSEVLQHSSQPSFAGEAGGIAQ